MILLALLLSFSQAHAETKSAIVRSISLFRNEIQLDIKKDGPIKVGSKFLAQTAVNHKCLLVVTRIVRDLAYADASQCPGYATLKKGQSVSDAPEAEVNEEIRVVPTPPAPTPQDS